MKRSSLASRHCPLARAGATIIDGWTLVILREILLKNCRFDGLLEQTGMSPRSLTTRLSLLIEEEILTKILYQEKPKRYEYKLTEKGRDFWPVIVTLKNWGERWCGPWEEDAVPMRLVHKDHDHDLNPKVVCRECEEEITVASGVPVLSAPMTREREEMKRIFRN